MGIRVEVQDGESIEHALRRFSEKQAFEYKRWSKKRYGYYEKPSTLRRKQAKMAMIWSMGERYLCDKRAWGRSGQSRNNSLHLYIGLRELFARTGPTNAAGR